MMAEPIKIAKIDTQTGENKIYDFGEGCLVGEPVFVPKAGSKKEDDGWILTMVYDPSDHHTFVGIVNPASFDSEHARVHLPFHVPLAFHGSFAKH